MSATPGRGEFSILIADDDRYSLDVLCDIMQPEGFRLFVASSGEEAIDLVQVHLVHLAVFDMHMPTLTGVETLRLARQFRAALPAILVTADPNDNVVRQAIAAQFFSIVPKPVNKSVLLYTVTRALQRHYGTNPEASDPQRL
ncbi:MAG: response regulator [Planctomycetia bacterium]|nr:response regulator [Planctomycetia bacterium]